MQTVRPAPFVIEPTQIETLTGGRWQGPRQAVTVYGAAIDSRKVRPGMVFACFVGEHVDGHDYAATAVGDGAAVLAQRSLDLPVPVLIVADVGQALIELAQLFRQRYQGACWIGITGSNGKTTVKEMLTQLLQAAGPVHATVGNYNNQLGVPLTILATPPGCRHVVVEMGASGPGDIAELAAIGQPDIGVITSIGPAHLDRFGDIPGVARGKTELFQAVPDGGPCYLGGVTDSHPADQVKIEEIIQQAVVDRELLRVDAGHQIAGHQVTAHEDMWQFADIVVPIHGQHNAANLALALRVARDRGLEIPGLQQGLRQLKPVAGRLTAMQLGHHTILDDSYNANPASMIAGLEELSRRAGGRVAVLGAMAELGNDTAALHRQVGAAAARLGLPLIVVASSDIVAGYQSVIAATGTADDQASWSMPCTLCDDVVQAHRVLRQVLAIGPRSVLVKASRSAGLDRLITLLLRTKA